MKSIQKEELAKGSIKFVGGIIEELEKSKSISLKELQAEDTALIIVDMINGFVREGALKSDRVEELIPEILRLIDLCRNNNIKVVAFGDSHSRTCPEFESYPEHCIEGTSESEVVDEIKSKKEYMLINKNSTNGFLESEFTNFLQLNSNISNFIIVGDCTDLCVLQFSLTLKAYFNKLNKKSNIVIPMNGVDTYDLGLHNGDFMNIFALYNMKTNGINVVKSIEE